MRLLFFLSVLFLSSSAFADCGDFKSIKSRDDLKVKIRKLLDNQSRGLKGTDSRHKIGDKLNQCIPSSDSTGLVIKFSGTGAFNPRANALMAEIVKCPKYQVLPSWLKSATYSVILSELRKRKSQYTKWSTVEKGIMSEFIKNSELNDIGKKLNFANFASEESEIIADTKYITIKNIQKILEEIKRSVNNFPIGIQNALICSLQYFNKAHSLNINPKLIILSHSSGGRTAVKFLEKLKFYLPNKKADLVMTIDPVREAQEALAEVLDQYIGNFGRAIEDYIPFIDEEQKPVNVWSRKQPKSLYKTTNSKRWINFYQTSDIDGIKLGIKFGIFGSPIHKADRNYFIKDDLGSSAHGKIGYQDEVLEIMTEEFLSLFAL